MPDDVHFRIGADRISAQPVEPGLYLVATPIGNLRDVSLRALDVLARADVVACEDTRTTKVLLQRYGLDRPRVSYTEHNADARGHELLARVEGGEVVALVSDAGTPLVSDPGTRLVAQARERSLRVFPVPGPAAPIAALVGSGLGGGAFLFHGFLPPKEKARADTLERLASERATLVFFESPARLAASLGAMRDAFGEERRACVAREITKRFETFHRGTLGELTDTFGRERPRGEIVVVVEGGEERAPDAEATLRDLLQEHTASRAAALAAKATGRPKRELYAMALEMKA